MRSCFPHGATIPPPSSSPLFFFSFFLPPPPLFFPPSLHPLSFFHHHSRCVRVVQSVICSPWHLPSIFQPFLSVPSMPPSCRSALQRSRLACVVHLSPPLPSRTLARPHHFSSAHSFSSFISHTSPFSSFLLLFLSPFFSSPFSLFSLFSPFPLLFLSPFFSLFFFFLPLLSSFLLSSSSFPFPLFPSLLSSLPLFPLSPPSFLPLLLLLSSLFSFFSPSSSFYFSLSLSSSLFFSLFFLSS